jgi:hypothetical protein
VRPFALVREAEDAAESVRAVRRESRLAVEIPSIVIACVVSADLLVVDAPFAGRQGAKVEAGQGQLSVKLPDLAAQLWLNCEY